MAPKCQINRNLLYLKLSYFLISTVRIATLPYVSLFSAKIVTFNQLAIIFSFVPITSIFCPIIIGFIADRTGQFKVMLVISLLMAAGAHTTVFWLYRVTTDPAPVVYDTPEANSLAHLSWNGSSFQLSTFNSSGAPWHPNVSVWLDVVSCHHPNDTDECHQFTESLDRIQLNRTDRWRVLNDLSTESLDSCGQFSCSVSVGNVTGSPDSGSKPSFVFPALFAIRMVGYIFLDSLNPLMDATALYMCKMYKGDFARQKMWSMGSVVCISILCGGLIDLTENLLGYKEYGVAFAIGGMAALLMIPLVTRLDVQVAKNKESMLRTVMAAGKMCDVSVFFLVEGIVGFCWGFHINFFPIYLDVELQASKTLLGMAISANGVGAMIVMATGTKIINRLGPSTTVAVSLLFVLGRFMLLYFLRSAWLVLVLELADGLCGFFALLAGSYFCAAAAPSGMMASFNGILSAAFFGAGRGLGSSVGSAVISAFGIRTAYLAFGIAAGVTSAVYLFVYHIALKKYERRRLEAKQSLETAKGIENAAIDQRQEPSTETRAS